MDRKLRAREALVQSRVTTGFEVINAPHRLRHDAYNFVLAAPWWRVILGTFSAYFGTNALFALAYYKTGGVHGVREDSFADAFFFSVQTLGTIGYGVYYPESTAAHLLVSLESFTGLTLVAVMTGIVFAKYSMPYARLIFTTHAVVTPFEGIPTLMFRIGNERGNFVINAQVSVVLMRTDRTQEGALFYRNIDLPLVRERVSVFARSFTVMHRVTPESPLYGETPDSLAKKDTTLVVTVVGLNGTSTQTIYAGWSYPADAVIFGSRHKDMLMELPGGRSIIDFANFDVLMPSQPIEGFPYPEPLRKSA
jgi:inward rectifier potassium channel